MRLLDLEPSVQQALSEGNVTEGHARALAGASPAGQRQLLEAVMARDLSVRQTEELVRRLRDRPTTRTGSTADPDSEMERLEGDLRRALGTKVVLARSRKGGRIVIEYYSDEEFSRLFDRLTGGVS